MELTSAAVAAYTDEVTAEDLPVAVVEAARRLVLDTIGCCLGAYTSPPSKHLRRLYGTMDGPVSATVFGAGTTTRPEYAGLINAAMGRYLDYNDTYISEGRACHPSDHIPALVSIAEAEGATGRDLLEAIVIAYEIEGLGLDTGVTWEQGYDYVSWGAYSSAAAVGKLMGLSRDQLADAIGIAGTSNLTLGISRRGAVTMWKGLAHPYVTHNAIQACQLARAGVTGPREVFEGPAGFNDVAAGRPLAIDRVGGRDDAAYRITEAHIKPYPCGYYMQPVIAGIIDLVREEAIDPGEIEAIRVRTFGQAAAILGGAEKKAPGLTRETADHSIPYTAAIAVLYGDVTPDHYASAYREDPRVHQLMDRVEVEADDGLNQHVRAHPRSTPSVVSIRTPAGRSERQVDYAPGHAENPLPPEELEAKFRRLTDPLLTADQSARVLRLAREFDDLPVVDPLVDALVV